MKLQQRLPRDLAWQIHRAVSSALWGDWERATALAGPINHALAAFDPMSAASLCGEIAQHLSSAYVLHQREREDQQNWEEVTRRASPLRRLLLGLISPAHKRRSSHAQPTNKRALPSIVPELAPILSCDLDGYVREASIRAWVPPAHSRFHLAMLLVRANDWVPEVRRLALRRLPEFWHTATAADRVCLSLLILDHERMGRIGEERVALERLITAPVERGEIVDDLKHTDGRHSVRLSSLVLRQPWIDPHLASLAREAKAPLVRARALNALTTGRVKWRTGRKEAWQGGSWGGMRRVHQYAQRTVHSEADLADAVKVSLTDRSSVVRRVAAEALGERPEAFEDAATLAKTLLDDRSRSIVERAAFAVRRSGIEGERMLRERVAAGKDRHGVIRAVIERGTMLKGN